ncbi:phage tail length tape measure family protein [Maricaulis maris]|uniref:Tail length tape measure protein n=1 Tax=Maricaulis maris TaxID=74318 RepID=A0A495DNG4_9PROT|nr:phage tail length tape measure family protein [Maricaulis maris]RKR03569.1 tail length tape measure protein [Maricaulis maris]
MAERLGVALLDLRTNDAGLASGMRNAKAGAQSVQASFNETSAKAALTTARIEQLTGVTGGLRRSATDITAYGSALDDMRARYNPVYAAIRQYRQAQTEVRQAHAVGAISADEMSAAISRERQQALASIAALRGRASAMDQLGRSTRNTAMQQRLLMFQMNDVFTTLAMGMNPLMVLIQQGPQISQIYGPGEGGAARAFREMGDMLTSAVAKFWPFIAVTGIAAAGIAGMTAAIDDTTKYSVTMGDVMIAAFQTIGDGVLTFIQPALDVLGGVFRQVWDGIVEGTRIVGNVLINGFRLVVLRVATEARSVAVVWGTALRLIADNWSRLPAVIGDVVLSAANRTISGIESMVNGAIDRINALIEMLPDWVEIDTLGQVSMGRLVNPFTGMADALKEDLVGLPGEIGREIATVLQEAAAEATDIVQSDPMGDFYRGTRDRAVARARDRANAREGDSERAVENPYRNLVRGAREFIAAQEVERQAMSLTDQAAAALRYEHDLLNQAMRANIKLTPAQREEIEALAREMASAEHETDALRERIDFLRTQTRSFVEDMREGMRQGMTVWEAFGSAVERVISRLVDRSLDQLVDAIFQTRDAMASTGAGAGGGGGIGGFISQVFAGFFANGGMIPAGQFGIVGEAGPEPVIGTSQGAKVLPNSALRSMGNGRQNSGFLVTVDKSKYFDTAVRKVSEPIAAQAAGGAYSMSQAVAEKRSYDQSRRLG